MLGFKWGLWYHLGSLAWGSFLVACVDMIKTIFEFYIRKMEYANNPIAKAFIWCTRCCIWCLDCCVKFINKNAYILVALHSTSFCESAWNSFCLVLRHVTKFSASGMSSSIMNILGKGIIIALSVWITILSLA